MDETLSKLQRELRELQFGSPVELKAKIAEAEQISRLQNDPETLARTLIAKTYTLTQEGKASEAFAAAFQAIELPVPFDIRAMAYIRLAVLLTELKQESAALHYSEYLDSRSAELSDDTRMRLALIYGRALLGTGKLDESMVKLGEGLHLATILEDERIMYSCIHSCGYVHMLKGDYELALERYRVALPYYIETRQFYNECLIEGQLGRAQLRLDPSRAPKHLKASLSIAEKHGFDVLLVRALAALTRYHRMVHEPELAEKSRGRALRLIEERALQEQAEDVLDELAP